MKPGGLQTESGNVDLEDLEKFLFYEFHGQGDDRTGESFGEGLYVWYRPVRTVNDARGPTYRIFEPGTEMELSRNLLFVMGGVSACLCEEEFLMGSFSEGKIPARVVSVCAS